MSVAFIFDTAGMSYPSADFLLVTDTNTRSQPRDPRPPVQSGSHLSVWLSNQPPPPTALPELLPTHSWWARTHTEDLRAIYFAITSHFCTFDKQAKAADSDGHPPSSEWAAMELLFFFKCGCVREWMKLAKRLSMCRQWRCAWRGRLWLCLYGNLNEYVGMIMWEKWVCAGRELSECGEVFIWNVVLLNRKRCFSSQVLIGSPALWKIQLRFW